MVLTGNSAAKTKETDASREKVAAGNVAQAESKLGRQSADGTQTVLYDYRVTAGIGQTRWWCGVRSTGPARYVNSIQAPLVNKCRAVAGVRRAHGECSWLARGRIHGSSWLGGNNRRRAHLVSLREFRGIVVRISRCSSDKLSEGGVRRE
jgi:hypothetical protein